MMVLAMSRINFIICFFVQLLFYGTLAEDDSSPLSCENQDAYGTFPLFKAEECDTKNINCYDIDALNSCCKCKPWCCGECNVTASEFDLYSPYCESPSPSFFQQTSFPTFGTYSEGSDAPSSGFYQRTPYPSPDYYPPYPTFDETSELDAPTFFFGLLVFCGVCCGFLYRKNLIVQNQQELNGVRRNMSERRRENQTAYPIPVESQSAPFSFQTSQIPSDIPSTTMSSQNPSIPVEDRATARQEEIMSQFYFQTVLPDKSNTSPDSIRVRGSEAATNNENDSDDGSIGREDGKNKKVSLSLRNMLASWRRPSSQDECCICLDTYNVGETICVAITTDCDHVFHQDCIFEWLKNRDCCPLCRITLMPAQNN